MFGNYDIQKLTVCCTSGIICMHFPGTILAYKSKSVNRLSASFASFRSSESGSSKAQPHKVLNLESGTCWASESFCLLGGVYALQGNFVSKETKLKPISLARNSGGMSLGLRVLPFSSNFKKRGALLLPFLSASGGLGAVEQTSSKHLFSTSEQNHGRSGFLTYGVAQGGVCADILRFHMGLSAGIIGSFEKYGKSIESSKGMIFTLEGAFMFD
jgi:hypothetical protein